MQASVQNCLWTLMAVVFLIANFTNAQNRYWGENDVNYQYPQAPTYYQYPHYSSYYGYPSYAYGYHYNQNYRYPSYSYRTGLRNPMLDGGWFNKNPGGMCIFNCGGRGRK